MQNIHPLFAYLRSSAVTSFSTALPMVSTKRFVGDTTKAIFEDKPTLNAAKMILN